MQKTKSGQKKTPEEDRKVEEEKPPGGVLELQKRKAERKDFGKTGL